MKGVATGEKARVSVIIPVYNGAGSVARAIDSALTQDFQGQEIIVVNDGSTDDTAEVLAGYGDTIRVIHKANGGAASARNAGIAIARGEYVAFLDADDVWLPMSLQILIDALSARLDAVLAFGDFIVVDERRAPLSESVFASHRDHGRAPTMAEMLEQTWPILPSATAVTARAIRDCGGFDEGFKAAGWEDFFLWLLLRERGPFVSVPEKIAIHVDHPDAAPDKYRAGLERFLRLVRNRYGERAAALRRSAVDEFSTKLFNRGWSRLKEARFAEASRDFALSARYSPFTFARNLKPMRRLRKLPVAIRRRCEI